MQRETYFRQLAKKMLILLAFSVPFFFMMELLGQAVFNSEYKLVLTDLAKEQVSEIRKLLVESPHRKSYEKFSTRWYQSNDSVEIDSVEIRWRAGLGGFQGYLSLSELISHHSVRSPITLSRTPSEFGREFAFLVTGFLMILALFLWEGKNQDTHDFSG